MYADVDELADAQVDLRVLHAADGVHHGVAENTFGHVADHRVVAQQQSHLAVPEGHATVQHVDRQVLDARLDCVEEFLGIPRAGARGPVERDGHGLLLRRKVVPYRCEPVPPVGPFWAASARQAPYRSRSREDYWPAWRSGRLGRSPGSCARLVRLGGVPFFRGHEQDARRRLLTGGTLFSRFCSPHCPSCRCFLLNPADIRSVRPEPRPC